MNRVKEMISALRKCAKEHEDEVVYTGQIVTSSLCRDVADYLEADLWHYPSRGEYPTERDWYLGIFEEPDTGFRLAPVVCDYVGKQTNATTKEGWLIRCLEAPNEYYQNLKCIAWQYIRTDEVYLKCIAWKDRVPPKEEA